MIDFPSFDPPRKRSIMIDGHATSVSLEDAFWNNLREMAAVKGVTLARLVTMIDHARPADVGLATAVRLTILAQAKRDQPPEL